MFAFLARNWFPLALVGLFLLTIPGLVLTILTLSGQDADLNTWLQENWNLTYHLALSPWLALLLLLLPLLILLLYFLKLKRKPLQVPSTFLWKKSIEDLHVNSLFQWLRQNILLVLQILILLVLIYSVLGIRFHGGATQSRHYILMIDNSASMSATDISPNRLEWAKEAALKEIDAAGGDDVGMVIVFNSKATTLQGYTNDKAKLRQAVQSIEPTQRSTRIDEAITLAESLANPVRSTEDVASQPPQDVPPDQERTFVVPKGIAAAVHLYSDGRFPRLSESALAALSVKEVGGTRLLGNLNLKYHRAGKPGAEHVNNIGLVAFNAVRHIGPKDQAADPDVQQLQVLVRARNYRPEPAKVRLQVDLLVDGQIIHPEQAMLNLPKRVVKRTEAESEEDEKDEPGEASATFVLPPVDLRGNVVLRAYLADHTDDFATDDQAWIAVGNVRKAKVLLVGPSNPILKAFFDQEAAERLVSVQELPATDKESYRKLARGGEVDLVIFDRCTLSDETDLPQANTWFIGELPPPWQKSDKAMKNPFILVSKKDHPLLRFLTTLWDLGVSEAHPFDIVGNLDPAIREKVKLPEGDKNRRALPTLTPLLEAGKSPVMFTLPRGGYTDLVMTFPLLSAQGDLMTNWPLKPSFPLFLRNVLLTLGNVDQSGRSLSVQPGEPMLLRPEAGVSGLKITPPEGKAVRLERGSRPDIAFADTDRLGVYTVERPDGGRGSFAVNLLDANESHVEPREEIDFGGDKIVAGQERLQPRDLWKWILLVALVLVLAEWYIYNKRVAV